MPVPQNKATENNVGNGFIRSAKSKVIIAENLGYIKQEQKTYILNKCYEIGKMINELLKKLG